MKNNDNQPWISPLKKIPTVLTPIVRAQEKHYGQILNPTRWWGRFPFLFWLVAFFRWFFGKKRLGDNAYGTGFGDDARIPAV